MLDLNPVKILVVLVVALIVLGPDKLPHLARQLGAAWGDFRRFRTRLESDVRGAFPDLPPTHEVAQAVRSPLSFLNRLADEHEKSLASGTAPPDAETTVGHKPAANGNGVRPVEPATPASTSVPGDGDPETWGPLAGVPDDPNMN